MQPQGLLTETFAKINEALERQVSYEQLRLELAEIEARYPTENQLLKRLFHNIRMSHENELPKPGPEVRGMEVVGTISNARCSECQHSFKEGDELLIKDALIKVIGGKLTLNDHNPNIICFPADSDGHYK